MLTVEEIESVNDCAKPAATPGHVMAPAELGFRQVFYPWGFPAEIRTNSELVLKQYEELWGKFTSQHETPLLSCDVRFVESSKAECPPEPTYRFLPPLMMCVADVDNYGAVDLDCCHTHIVISSAALHHRLYAQYFLLQLPSSCIATRYTTPVHAGCVALEGRGILLCGESGAGKSTLSYACARAGFTYISDDASFLLNGGMQRRVTGNCHQVRFRPSAGELFPEIKGLEITPRAAGKPSIELPTSSLPGIRVAQNTQVDYIVFLNRREGASASLSPGNKQKARLYMRQVLYGLEASIARQQQAIEHLLAVPIFELEYSALDPAVERLEQLCRKRP